MARNSIDTFPARLRGLREARGLTRDRLAVEAGTSSASVAKLEQGARAPSLELAWRIAQALEVTLDDLVQPEGGGIPRRRAGGRRSSPGPLPPRRRRPRRH